MTTRANATKARIESGAPKRSASVTSHKPGASRDDIAGTHDHDNQLLDQSSNMSETREAISNNAVPAESSAQLTTELHAAAPKPEETESKLKRPRPSEDGKDEVAKKTTGFKTRQRRKRARHDVASLQECVICAETKHK